jgi:uncharacterized RDD family membrane protein YckC
MESAMQTINVRTTQNVLIGYSLAGLFDRVLAFIIDAVIFFTYLILALLLLAAAEAMATWTLILVYLPIFFYNLLFEILMNGQTPGKRAMNIKVVRLDGSSPTIANYCMRFILWPIDIVLSGSIAITFILLTKNSQRLGDLAAGTTVIKLLTAPPVTSQKIMQSLNDNYVAQFPQVVNLSDRDISIIKEALDTNVQFGNEKPVLLIAEKLKKLHGIETDISPSQFLYTVLKDYHHITSNL